MFNSLIKSTASSLLVVLILCSVTHDTTQTVQFKVG